MATKKTAVNDDSASDLVSSLMVIPAVHNANPVGIGKRHKKTPGLRKKPVRSTALSSSESHISFGSVNSSQTSTLSNAEAAGFRRCIEREKDALERSDAGHCCYIEERLHSSQALDQLAKYDNGTYFVRPASLEEEQTLNVKYALTFVCHKQVIEVAICCDKERRAFWFLSGCGNGAEVKREYSGIDVLIQHKQENNFYELQYPFRICLYKPYQPVDPSNIRCIPLPAEVRARGSRNTILHEFATRGLTKYFNELIRIAKKDDDPLRDTCLYIANKINGRNETGQTPLILAIQSLRYEFVEILLDNKADANIIDSQGCSPLHYACRKATPRLLKKLIDRQADPHYINPRHTADGTNQSHLSAFHYLAMANEASSKNIKRCAEYLFGCGCPLMPLTHKDKTPFDIAQLYNNNAYECVKAFYGRHQFNNLSPMDVSSRNDAKRIISDLACPDVLGKLRSRLKQSNNRIYLGCDGLFLFYKTQRTRSEPNGEFGLCVHHAGKIFAYPISQKHQYTTTDLANPPRKITFSYSLMTENSKSDPPQVALFSSYDELIYNHTKYKGILATTLKDFVRKENSEMVASNAKTLVLLNTHISPISDNEETEFEDVDDDPPQTPVAHIDRFSLSHIYSATILNENHRRLIWLAKVRLGRTVSFPIIIKDYLPNKDLDSYKQHRSNELNPHSQHRTVIDQNEFSFEFSSRTHLEYTHESRLLLKELKHHPFIVHTFICNHDPKNDLRIFMEYLPCGNLHSYLSQLESNSVDPLMNAFHWIYQMGQVMAYLSNKKIVHRDLATRNILFRDEQHIKLSDFGLSRYEGVIPEGKDCILSPRWTAPECFARNQKIVSSSDVWSFGVVIWEIYSFGALPYDAEIKNDTQQLVRLLTRFLVEQGRRLSRPISCSESMYDLMCRCWNGNADKRPGFVDIIDDLNGVSTRKDRIVQFTHEERKAWKQAKEEYLLTSRPIQTFTSDGENYIIVEDTENDDKDNIITCL